MNRILVTGATGSVGGHLVRLLHERGVPVRAFVRDRGAAGALLDPEIDVVVGDFGDPGSVRAALDGVQSVFLTCANHPLQVQWETTVIDAAARAGVPRVVRQSALGAELGSPVAFLDANARIDDHLRASGLDHALLKPAFKMSNLLAATDSVRRAGAIFLPGAGARIAMIDPRDVAEVATVLLANDRGRAGDVGSDLDGRSHELTGPAAVTFDDVAQALSVVTRRRVGFVAVSDDAAREQLVAGGAPEWFAEFEAMRGVG